MGRLRGRCRPGRHHVPQPGRLGSLQCQDYRRGQGRPPHPAQRRVTAMKSTKIASDAGAETRVVILESGEEAFEALTKFANDAGITAASLTPSVLLRTPPSAGSILRRKHTRK